MRLFKLIDKLLWPKRVAQGKPCNQGIWWWLAPIMQALGSIGSAVGGAASAIGSGIGSAAGAIGEGIGSIGSALGLGGGSTAAGTAGSASTGAASMLGVGQAGGVGGLAGGSGAGLTSALSAPAVSSLASTAAPIATHGGTALATKLGAEGLGVTTAKSSLLKDVAGLAAGELLGIDPNASLKENVGNVAVKQVADAKNQKEQVNVNIDNSFSGQAPTTQAAPAAGKQGGEKPSLSPEQMMQLVQMLKRQQAQGGSVPLGASPTKFPGGYY